MRILTMNYKKSKSAYQQNHSKEIDIIESRVKPTWLPNGPLLTLGVKGRLFYERIRAKSEI